MSLFQHKRNTFLRYKLSYKINKNLKFVHNKVYVEWILYLNKFIIDDFFLRSYPLTQILCHSIYLKFRNDCRNLAIISLLLYDMNMLEKNYIQWANHQKKFLRIFHFRIGFYIKSQVVDVIHL